MGRNRLLLKELIRRDIEQRYRGSALGFLWSLLDPAWQLLLFTFVFAVVLRIELPGEATSSFPIFLFAGLLAWNPVRQGVERGTTAITASGPLMKGNRFPPALFVLAVVLSEVIHGVIATALFVVVLAAVGVLSPSGLLLLVPAVALQIAFTFGLALLVSATNVYARDVQRGVTGVLSAWFYATPIVYPLALVPVAIAPIIRLNPLNGIVTLYRAALLGGQVDRAAVAALLVGTAVLLLGGRMIFGWLESGFVDEV